MTAEELAANIDSLRTLVLKPGDAVVVRTVTQLTEEQTQEAAKQLQAVLGVPVFVLSQTVDIDILRFPTVTPEVLHQMWHEFYRHAAQSGLPRKPS